MVAVGACQRIHYSNGSDMSVTVGNSAVRWKSAALPAAILLVGVMAFLFLSSLKAAPSREERKVEAPLVETVAIEPAPEAVAIRVNGTVAPKRVITLSAEVAGKIIFKAPNCRAGAYVEKGAPLLKIDARSYELELRRLQSESRQVEVDLARLDIEKSNNKSMLDISKSDVDLAQRERERIETLKKKNAASDSERDAAESHWIKARNSEQSLINNDRLLDARRDWLKAQAELMKSRVDLAKLNLERTEIVAPLNGIVVAEMVEENGFVQPGGQLAKIRDSSAVEVRCSLLLSDLRWLWSGQEAEITDAIRHAAPVANACVMSSFSGRDYCWKGFLSRFEGEGLDEKTRTLPCRIEVPAPAECVAVGVCPDRGTPIFEPPVPLTETLTTKETSSGAPPVLLPGMFVTVVISAKPAAPLLQIPFVALRPGNEVWLVRNGALMIAPVRVARIFAQSVLIHADDSELRPGDRVVISPLAAPLKGMAVRDRPSP